MNTPSIDVLLVEDDEIDIMNIRRAFLKNRIDRPITVARNGLEALETLRNLRKDPDATLPRVVLLDINMPRMNGIEFLKEVRKDPCLQFLNVIVMTTSDEDSDKIEAHKLNVAGYIVKPLSFERFTETVRTLEEFWRLTEFP